MDQSIAYLSAELVVKEQYASTSLLTRRLGITYENAMKTMMGTKMCTGASTPRCLRRL